MLKFFGSSDIKLYIKNYFEGRDDLENKVVVDIPAGTGVNTKVLQEKGARVKAYDLFPEFFDVEGLNCDPPETLRRMPEHVVHLPPKPFRVAHSGDSNSRL